jgi:drug/metabolite transporter (DMT)-like permease
MSTKTRPRTKPISKKYRASRPQPKPRWRKILLALAFAPLILGIVLVVARVANWNLPVGRDDQAVFGALLLFFSFFWMNAVQENWPLAAGWLLLAIADYLIFSLRIEWTQRIGAVLGLGGILIVVYEYFRKFTEKRSKR